MTPEDREIIVEALARPVDLALSRIACGECPIVLRPVMEVRADGLFRTTIPDVDVVLHTRRCVVDLAADDIAVHIGAQAMRVVAREAGLTWSTELMGRSPAETLSSRASVALLGAAAEVVRACHEGAAREAAVSRVLEDLADFLATERSVWRLRAPVSGVSVLGGSHQLTEDITIRAADNDFKHGLWAKHGPGAPQSATLSEEDAVAVRDFDSVIELIFERDRDAWPVMYVLNEKVNRVLTALRVFGARRLVAPLVWIQAPSAIERFGRGHGSILQQDRSALERAWRAPGGFGGSAAVVDARLAEELRSWTEQLSKRPTDDALMFAVQRFNLADARASDDDRLVDAWVALEALFSTRKERGAIAYRTALRLALLNGTDPNDRQRIRSFVNLSYGLRSTVVHGTPVGARPKKYEPAAEVVSGTEDLLRETLRRWVHAGYSEPAQVISLLEAQALNGDPLP